MTNDDLAEAINLIRNGLNDVAQAHVSQYIGSEDWLWNLFSRAVLLTGGRAPLFSDAQLTESGEGPIGSIVVVTDVEIVRVKFDQPTRRGVDYFHEVVIAESVPRRAVRSIGLDALQAPASNTREWPLHVQITLTLDRELAGEDTLKLPLGEQPARDKRAAALTALVGF